MEKWSRICVAFCADASSYLKALELVLPAREAWCILPMI